jgi:glycosyltransferase involved in cell wall biosynthesis
MEAENAPAHERHGSWKAGRRLMIKRVGQAKLVGGTLMACVRPSYAAPGTRPELCRPHVQRMPGRGVIGFSQLAGTSSDWAGGASGSPQSQEGALAMHRPPRVLMVTTVDWFFLSHRLSIARAAREAGCDVWVAAADTGKAESVVREGMHFVPIPMWRKSANPFRELWTFLSLIWVYSRVRPDLVHHVALKPIVYGSLAAALTRRPAILNAITGFGFSFSEGRGAALRRALARPLLRVVLHMRRSRTIFQNPEARSSSIETGLVPADQTILIRGSGVNCSRFTPSSPPPSPPIVMLASRMLWDKGVGDFVEAARLLRRRSHNARFVLVGRSDPGNKAGIHPATLHEWEEAGDIEWWGHVDDMPWALAQASVVVLPSHHEGLPKILLEAAAMEKPIVATDIPGCREVVRHRTSGLLVPPHDPAPLALAIAELLERADLRLEYGKAGRRLAVEEFAEELVVAETLRAYRDLLPGRWPER